MVTNNRVVMATEELQLQVPLKTRSKGASDLSLVVDTHNDGRGWKVPLLSPSPQSGRSLMSCAWWIPLAQVDNAWVETQGEGAVCVPLTPPRHA